MKSLWVYVVAVACGIGIGVTGTLIEFASDSREAVARNGLGQLRLKTAEVGSGAGDSVVKGPIATVLGEKVHDFGTMERRWGVP